MLNTYENVVTYPFPADCYVCFLLSDMRCAVAPY